MCVFTSEEDYLFWLDETLEEPEYDELDEMIDDDKRHDIW